MMRSVELRLKVTPEGQVLFSNLPELEPGEYNAVLVVEAEAVAPLARERGALHLPLIEVGPWPEHLSLRREDLYGDEP
jgi:hypothetical protein